MTRPAHTPAYRSPVARSSENKQDNSGLPAPNLSDLSRQWIADGQRRPRIGSPRRVHALNHREAAEFTFEPARRSRLKAGLRFRKFMPQDTKVRLRFAKRGDLRLVSHHDLLRCLERMLRRAQVPIAQTQGYSPRPKITFALALGLGIESLCEVVDLELAEPLEPAELLARLQAVAPPGFDWTDARPLPAECPASPTPGGRVFVPRATRPPCRGRRRLAVAPRKSKLALDPDAAQGRIRFRPAAPPDRGRSDGRGLASVSFESRIRRLRPPGRAARGPCACATCWISGSVSDPDGPRAFGGMTRSICFVAQTANPRPASRNHPR